MITNGSRVREARAERAGCRGGAGRAGIRGWHGPGSVRDADPEPAEALALVLDLDDLDPADLARRGDVRAPVGLLVQAHDVDDPDLFDLGRDEVRGGADDVGNGERLIPRQDPDRRAAARGPPRVAGRLRRLPGRPGPPGPGS